MNEGWMDGWMDEREWEDEKLFNINIKSIV
jgi:hypothetical protein